MRAMGLVVGVALAAMVLPASASGAANNGSDCSYANGAIVNIPTGPPPGNTVVYAEAATNSSGASDSADVAAGACVNVNGLISLSGIRVDGAVAEVGAGDTNSSTIANGPGAYAIVDGDNQNVEPFSQGDGYAGVSNYESVPGTSPCGGGGTDGPDTNGGACISVGTPFGPVVLPVPVACGNTSGPTWNSTTNDGCNP
jgi:hypothetical protein